MPRSYARLTIQSFWWAMAAAVIYIVSLFLPGVLADMVGAVALLALLLLGFRTGYCLGRYEERMGADKRWNLNEHHD